VNKYYALIAERERTYSEGNLIEHGESPGEEYMIGYDLVQHLSDAKIESAKGVPVNVQTVEIQSVPRHVIFAHPPSKITYNLTVEPGSSLAFAIGILPAAWDKIPQGVKFDIDVVCDGVTESLFSRVLMPKRNVGDRGWHNFILPLEKYSGKTVSLVLSTSGSGDDLSYCWSAWGWGKIVKPELVLSSKNSDHALSNVFSSGEERFGNKRGEIILVELLDKNFNRTMVISSGEIAHVRIHGVLHEDIQENLTIGCTFKSKYCDIYGTNTKWQRLDLNNKKQGVPFVVEFSQPLKINSGTYSINAGLVIARSDHEIEVLDRRYDCLLFTVEKKENMVGIVDLEASVKEIQI
jgi:hypothetical protein